MVNLALGLILLPAVHMPAGTYPLALTLATFSHGYAVTSNKKGAESLTLHPG
jgi:hypothetical protein